MVLDFGLSALEYLGFVFALVDDNGVVHTANAHAKTLLAETDDLPVDGKEGALRLKPHSPTLKSIRHALNNGGGYLRIAESTECNHLYVHILSATSLGLHEECPPDRKIACLIGRCHCSDAKQVHVRAFLDGQGLTQAQAEVIIALFDGQTPKEIATENGVSLATIRSHLSASYHKLGIRSQMDMVRLLASI